jgi:hypothetical protein
MSESREEMLRRVGYAALRAYEASVGNVVTIEV